MPLVTYDEQASFLEIPSGTDKDLIEELVANTTKLFENECGRSAAPFSAAQTGRIEIHEGSVGSNVLTLDYPIASITSIVVGRDIALPDETLVPSDPAQVVWRVGGRDLIRMGGAVWRRYSQRWVKVVYNTLDDWPGDAKIAVKRRVSQIYNERGAEGFTSGSRGARSWAMADGPGQRDQFWEDALRNHRQVWVR